MLGRLKVNTKSCDWSYLPTTCRGIDYMVEAKLAEGRAKEAEQKVQGRCMVVMQVLEHSWTAQWDILPVIHTHCDESFVYGYLVHARIHVVWVTQFTEDSIPKPSLLPSRPLTDPFPLLQFCVPSPLPVPSSILSSFISQPSPPYTSVTPSTPCPSFLVVISSPIHFFLFPPTFLTPSSIPFSPFPSHTYFLSFILTLPTSPSPLSYLVLQTELLQSQNEVRRLLDRVTEASRDKSEMVSSKVHIQLLQIADEKAAAAEQRTHELEKEVCTMLLESSWLWCLVE